MAIILVVVLDVLMIMNTLGIPTRDGAVSIHRSVQTVELNTVFLVA